LIFASFILTGLSWPFDTAAASVVGGGIGERLDYVFYSGGGANSTSQQQLLMMRPVNAFLYPTRSASSGKFYYTQNGGVNIEWPSDHFAVVVDFEWRREHA
jgi:endonuclease/exonuclease/phosphatase (EEP) superfamily protein YafD